MMTRTSTLMRLRVATFALLLAVPAALASADVSQPASAAPSGSPELVDPDCDPEGALHADPSLVEEPDGMCPPIDPDCDPEAARQADPSLVKKPDGVCRPDEQGQHSSDGSTPTAEGGDRQRRSGSRKPRSNPDAGGAPAGHQAEDGGRGRRTPLPNLDGPQAPNNPGSVDALPGPFSAAGVPSFVLRRFRVPVFLLPIYQAAAIQYGVRWEVLAAVNEIETDYGRNLNVSSAGAVGWMQFLPSTWRMYGVDANGDGKKDPYNPVDAIFAAARYLKAAGYERDVRRAIFAYNHADWYVESVLLRARLIAGVPADLVDSLTGLAEGRSPIHAHARYGDDLVEDEAPGRVTPGRNAANAESNDDRRGIEIFSRPGAPVVAVNDGVVKDVGRSERLGRYIVLQDVYGNRYTYARLGSVSRYYPLPKEDATDPQRLRRMKKGARVIGGTTLGRIGITVPAKPAHLYFEIRPAGRGAPRIDPKPILDGWKLLEATAIYSDSGRNALDADDEHGMSIGQILLLPKPRLERRVLSDEDIEIYPCGRRDIRAGRIDRRVLGTLAYLSESGFRPTVTSLRCGHSFYTSSGGVSHHSSGNAVDISKVNGVPILGHQERGGITEQTVRHLMRLQGAMTPDQIISLLDLGDPTVAMGDHVDHIHVGFRPRFGAKRRQDSQASVLTPGQWSALIDQLRRIDNPVVPTKRSTLAIAGKQRVRRGGHAHIAGKTYPGFLKAGSQPQ
jgi:hypothetical protein